MRTDDDPAVVNADLAFVPAGDASLFAAERDCAIWNTEPAPAVENEPVASSIPTLVFAGAFDPVTPPTDSRSIADRFTGATYIEIPNGGHGVAPTTACGRQLLEASVGEPYDHLDLACVNELGAPDWQS